MPAGAAQGFQRGGGFGRGLVLRREHDGPARGHEVLGDGRARLVTSVGHGTRDLPETDRWLQAGDCGDLRRRASATPKLRRAVTTAFRQRYSRITMPDTAVCEPTTTGPAMPLLVVLNVAELTRLAWRVASKLAGSDGHAPLLLETMRADSGNTVVVGLNEETCRG
jgi:hypothetical protein